MRLCLAAALCIAALPAAAQNFTTAAEVKPILQATKANWIAVREWDGQDLIYFTQILSWRCGLDQILYSVNSGPTEIWEYEPCHEGTAQPNAFDLETHLPYITRPPGSVETVKVSLFFDDGTMDSESYDRAAVLMP